VEDENHGFTGTYRMIHVGNHYRKLSINRIIRKIVRVEILSCKKMISLKPIISAVIETNIPCRNESLETGNQLFLKAIKTEK
jgi:hypothetical protein